MKTITTKEFNKLPIGRRVKVYAPDVCDNPVEGYIDKNKFVVDKYVTMTNGDEIFAFQIKGIWGIDKNGNREEL